MDMVCSFQITLTHEALIDKNFTPVFVSYYMLRSSLEKLCWTPPQKRRKLSKSRKLPNNMPRKATSKGRRWCTIYGRREVKEVEFYREFSYDVVRGVIEVSLAEQVEKLIRTIILWGCVMNKSGGPNNWRWVVLLIGDTHIPILCKGLQWEKTVPIKNCIGKRWRSHHPLGK